MKCTFMQLHPAGLCRWHQFLSPGNWWEGTLETDPEVLQPSTNTDLPYWLTVLWLCCMGRERLVVWVLPDAHYWTTLLKRAQKFFHKVSQPELVSCYNTRQASTKRSGYYRNLGSMRAGTRHHGEFLHYGNSFPPTFPVQMTGQLSRSMQIRAREAV